MGGGHHDYGERYKIPDYRIYKVEDAPRLVELQKVLAAKGLKDPWIRNEVWRYNGEFGTTASNMKLTFFKGFKLGLAAFLATIAAETIYDKMSADKDHDHH